MPGEVSADRHEAIVGGSLTLACGAVLSNRLAKAATSEQLGTWRHAPGEGLRRLYARWAHSGAGLLITGNVMVDRTALGEPRNVVVDDTRDLRRLRGWAAAARGGGAHAWVQLNHPGRQSPRTLSRRPVAPSAVPMAGMRGPFAAPRELSGAEIERVIGAFAAAAGVVVRAGFTGVQVHAAHGYLISQFLSPLVNRRTDAWGGTAEKRRRFLLETVAAVRATVGPGVPVSVKLNSADFQRGGLDSRESPQVAFALAEAGIDLLEISGGTYQSPAPLLGLPGQGGRPLSASTRAREAYFLEFARTVRAHTAVPIMLTGGFRTLPGMAQAIADGAVDIIGLARPMAVEPDLPRRLLTGRAAASTARPRRIGLRPLEGMAELSWYQAQLSRMGHGHDPDPGLHPLRSLLRYNAAGAVGSLVGATRRRRGPGPAAAAPENATPALP